MTKTTKNVLGMALTGVLSAGATLAAFAPIDLAKRRKYKNLSRVDGIRTAIAKLYKSTPAEMCISYEIVSDMKLVAKFGDHEPITMDYSSTAMLFRLSGHRGDIFFYDPVFDQLFGFKAIPYVASEDNVGNERLDHLEYIKDGQKHVLCFGGELIKWVTINSITGDWVINK